MHADERPVSHVDDEQLAAFIDGALGAEERAAVELHLAACDRCRMAFAEIARTVSGLEAEAGAGEARRDSDAEDLDDEGVSEAAHVVPLLPRRSRVARWVYAGGGLAAAAAIVLAVWWPTRTTRPTVSGLADLVAAVGTDRPFEPRLTGGFRHGVVRNTRGGGDEALSPEVRIAAARIEQEYQAARSVEGAAAFGTAALVSGRVTAAIEALEYVRGMVPRSGAASSDLAAAWLLQADRDPDGRVQHLVRALEFATSATEVAPAMPEAWFNKALALEALGDEAGAISAWEQVVVLEQDEAWVAEARGHLARLRKTTARTPAPESSAPVVEQAILDLRATLGRAASLEEICRVTRRSLRTAFSTDLEREACQTGHDAPQDGQVAAALVLLSEAVAALYRERVAESRAAADRAYQALPEAASALRARALLVHVTADYWDRRRDHARLHTLSVEAGRGNHTALLGEVALLEGLWHWQDVRPDAAVQRVLEAEAQFRAAGDRVGESRARRVRAAFLHMLGATDLAWSALTPALLQTKAPLRPLERYLELSAASLLALDTGAPRSSLAYQSRAVAAAELNGAPGPIIESLCRRAELQLELMRADAAAADLARASVLLATNPDAYLRGACAWSDAMTTLDANPQQAVARLSTAIDLLETRESSLMPALLHLRARGWRRLNDTERSRKDLDAAIDRLEAQQAQLPDTDAQLTFADRAADVFDEAADLLLTDLGDGKGALMMLERGRQRGSSGHQPAFNMGALAAFDGRVALLAYSLRDDEVVTWVLRGQRTDVHRARVPRALVNQRIQAVARDPMTATDDLVSLSRLLLQHIPRDVSVLAIVPDDELARVPYSMLQLPTGHRVLEQYAVVIAPSVTAALAGADDRSRLSRPLSVVVAGADVGPVALYPQLRPLRHAVSEARAVAGHYPGATVLSPREMTAEHVQVRLVSSDVFHFAGHAVVNERVPSLSSLVLSGQSADGFLPAARISRLDLSALRLAVLSGCQTAGGRTSRSAGVVGLARMFIDAGARNVVASLWDINDARTLPLMEAFHRHYIHSGDPIGALRLAQLEQLASYRLNPAVGTDWAAFIVVGSIGKRT